MFKIHTRYILGADQQPVAVQISLDQFQKIAEILEASGQVILMKEDVDEAELKIQDEAWMQADLSNLGSHEPYEWEAGELEEGLPIQYVPGTGLVVTEE